MNDRALSVRISTLFLSLAIVAVTGCDDAPPVAGSARPVSPAPSTTIATPLGPSAAVPSSAPSAIVRPPNVFTDAQMLGVLTAANTKEIEQSKVLVEQSKDAAIKSFAEMMVKHHGEAQKKLDALGDAGKPASSPEATEIEEGTRAAVQRFRSLSGAELDRAYVDLMVRDHTEVLDLVTRRMQPVVASAGLKARLADDLRPTIEKHLEAAKELAAKSGSTAASGAPSAGAPAPSPSGSPSAGASAPAPKSPAPAPK